ncbi:DNA-processing protein DprA [Gordonia paraffinivorans]|uniref:DNA-processing protein DprA n=1 Tax=Gordonia paraffinivorans TaxID=175628 RepID=UPI0024312283|nr:DNA-processing protein DprA [Gordonia paraffinivorans]
MSEDIADLERVLYAAHLARTPARTRDALLDPVSLEVGIRSIADKIASEIEENARRLHSAGVRVIPAGSSRFPPQLQIRGKAVAPALFYRGDPTILDSSLIAVSGSRKVSESGAAAAARLGDLVAKAGHTLVHGNARGVDTLAGAAALSADGRTVAVLPEGIDRTSVDHGPFRPDLLVLSQFAPDQPWTVHTAMSRNRVICGLAHTVVVVEAGETGGSLAAGREALKLKRRLLVLTYRDQTPVGNRTLIEEGGQPVSSPDELAALLSASRSSSDGQRGLF